MNKEKILKEILKHKGCVNSVKIEITNGKDILLLDLHDIVDDVEWDFEGTHNVKFKTFAGIEITTGKEKVMFGEVEENKVLKLLNNFFNRR